MLIPHNAGEHMHLTNNMDTTAAVRCLFFAGETDGKAGLYEIHLQLQLRKGFPCDAAQNNRRGLSA